MSSDIRIMSHEFKVKLGIPLGSHNILIARRLLASGLLQVEGYTPIGEELTTVFTRDVNIEDFKKLPLLEEPKFKAWVVRRRG